MVPDAEVAHEFAVATRRRDRFGVSATAACASLFAFGLACWADAASAAWVNINLARGQLYLIVGPETAPLTGGTVAVSFTVPAAQLGDGTSIAGTPNVHVQLGLRRPRFSGNISAPLVVTAPATVDSGPNQIPISDFSWTTTQVAGAPGSALLIGPGTLAAGAQTIYTLTTSNTNARWAAGLFTFRYANTQAYPAGGYGPATINFTATRP
jgi:hypothetical protein